MPCLVDNYGTPALLWIETGCGHRGEVVGEMGETVRKIKGKQQLEKERERKRKREREGGRQGGRGRGS